MALAQPQPSADGDLRSTNLILRLDPLHNWTDLIVLGVSIALSGYLGAGELFARGWANNTAGFNDLSIFAPLLIGLCVMTWRRFRQVSLVVGEDVIEAVSVLGVRKTCLLDALTSVTEAGRPAARQLVFVRGETAAFRVLKQVWTSMQLETLATFIGVPISNSTEPFRSRLDRWIAGVFKWGFDALFVVMAGSALVSAVAADREAHAYLAARSICVTHPAELAGSCYTWLPVTVSSVGSWSFGRYAITLQSPSETFEVTAVSNRTHFSAFHPGMTSYAKRWKGKPTLLEVTDTTSIQTTDHPLYAEGQAHLGLSIWILALIGLVPLLRRLHPIVT